MSLNFCHYLNLFIEQDEHEGIGNNHMHDYDFVNIHVTKQTKYNTHFYIEMWTYSARYFS